MRLVPLIFLVALSSQISWSASTSGTDFFLPDIEFASPEVSPSLFRETYAFLDDQKFAEKKSAASESAWTFFRSYVNTFYADLAPTKQLGPLGTCFGDAHAENFGFILFKEGPEYVFNDLDDSGQCAIGSDLLRYFVSLHLIDLPNQLLEEAIETYGLIVRNEHDSWTLKRHLYPDLEKKRKKHLKEYTSHGRFIIKGDLSTVSPEGKNRIRSEVAQVAELAPEEILDVVFFARNHGGSAGQDRYWALIEPRHGSSDILELKEELSPGVAYGQWPQKNEPNRFQKLQQAFWNGLTPLLSPDLTIDNHHFLLRSRTKASLDILDLNQTDRRNALLTQVSLLAVHHRKYWPQQTSGLEKWIRLNSALLADRYRRAYSNSRVGRFPKIMNAFRGTKRR